ncbi:MAG: hypothetical protein JW819_13360, partial [Candidatus Krumholzibacteriota bacterium]|nr:hypothetical protein [Candidatus Krumholzibacteriota bacterium]
MSHTKPLACLLLLGLLAAGPGLAPPSAEAATYFTIPHGTLLNHSEYGVVSWGSGSFTRTDAGGTAVDFAFTGLSSGKMLIKDDFDVENVYGQTGGSHNADFTNFTGYALMAENLDDQTITMHLFINTGFTSGGSQQQNDTFWAGPWVDIPAGRCVLLTLDFDGAEAWNISDNPAPHTGGDLSWPNGGIYAINTYDRGEVTAIGFEVADFSDTNPNGTLRLTPRADALLAPLPPVSGPIGAGGHVDIDFHYEPDLAGPELRGYSVRVQATSALSFTDSDVTFLNPTGAADTYTDVIDNGTNDYTIDFAILGGTTGIDSVETIFRVRFHAAGDGDGVVSIAAAELRDLDNDPVSVDHSCVAQVGVDVTAPTGALAIDGGAAYTTDTEVTLNSSVTGASEMR